MKQLFFALSLFIGSVVYSQVGINTDTPKITLEVVGSPNVVTVADGVMAPRISRAELIAKTAYSLDQTGAIVYVTDLSGITNAATANITSIGYYYFSGSTWISMGSGAKLNYGDTKLSYQTADHNGWIKLDGRALSSLPSALQTRAMALGISTNLPDNNQNGKEDGSNIYQSDSGWGSNAYVSFTSTILQNLSTNDVSRSADNKTFTLSKGKYIIEWESGYETTGYSFINLYLDGSVYGGNEKYATAGAGGNTHYVGSTIRQTVIDATSSNKLINFFGRVGVATIKITKLKDNSESKFIYLGE